MDYKIETTPTGLYRIKYNGKGSMPVPLRGLYTSKGQITKAINSYLANKEVKTNAKDKARG